MNPKNPVSTNVPIPLTSFVGREAEVEELDHLLQSVRLLTLTGPGGVGKTRLALELLRRQTDRFPDGCWLIELAAITDTGLLPSSVAAVLRIPNEPGQALFDRVAEFLRPRQLLLLFDNCEHLVEASAALAEELLGTCPGLTVLTTSREPLGVLGESVRPVAPLPVPPDDGHHGGSALASAAVRLFVDRATAASSFQLTEASTEPVIRICRRLDGIPLALELAAGATRVLNVEQIAERLDDCFRLLSFGSPTSPPRHRTLRACIDWSHNLLSEPEQRLFRRLSVFAGGWTIESAEPICSDDQVTPPEVLDLLRRLVEKSLVVTEDRTDGRRFRLLETLRQYAEEQLHIAGEETGLLRRYVRWHQALAEKGQVGLRGPDQGKWRDRLEVELDNIRSAIRWSLSDPESVECGLGLATRIWQFWLTRQHLQEGWDTINRLLEVAGHDHPGRKDARVFALTAAGRLGILLGHLEQAQSFLEEALLLGRSTGDGAAATLCALGMLANRQDRLDAARTFLDESLTLTRARGPGNLGYTVLMELGWNAYLRGRTELARELWEQTLQEAHEQANPYYEAATHTWLGLIGLRQGGLEKAEWHARAGVRQRWAIGNWAGIPQGLTVLAAISASEGQLERALRLAGAAGSLRKETTGRLPPVVLADLQERLQRCQQILGERAAKAASAAGVRMDLARAVAYALEGPGVEAETSAPVTTNPLTRREHEVAHLLRRGLTNRQIASELVIAEGTVGIHVDHILAKLGFHSRAQVAAWVAQEGLTTDDQPSGR